MLPSASSVPRALVCAASAVLPQQDYRTKFADDGQERHEEQESSVEVGDWHPDLEQFREDGQVIATECAFVYDVATDTARELGHVARQYRDLAPTEIAGTMDLLIRGKRLIVVDYKSFELVDPAATNEQTATYALMAARTYGYDEVTVVIIYLVGGRKPDIAVLSALELDGHAARLKEMVETIEHARRARDLTPYLKRSKQCRYCPAYLACPVQMRTVIDIGTGELAQRAEAMIPLESDQDAATAFDLLEHVTLVQKRLKAAVMARAADRPFMTARGTMYGKVQKLGPTKLNGEVAYRVLKKRYGDHIAQAGVTMAATQAGMKRAVELQHAKGGLAAAMRELMAEIEREGGAKRDEREAIEEYAAEGTPALEVPAAWPPVP